MQSWIKQVIVCLLVLGLSMVLYGATSDYLVAHWKLDGDVTDQTGNHDGTLHDGGAAPVWVAGHDGQALAFDGVDDYIEANSVCTTVAGSDITVAAWVKANTNSSNHQIVWAFNAADGANRIILGQRISNPNLLIHLDGDWRDSGQVVYDNTWHHVACVLSVTDGLCSLFVDGVYANLFSTAISIDASDMFSIGQDYDHSGLGPVRTDFFDGIIDDVRLYDRALSDEEVADFMAPVLEVSDDEFTFAAPELGPNPSSQTLTIQNTGSDTLNWSIDTAGKPDWLTISSAFGALSYGQSEPVTLTVEMMGLAPGLYSYSFDVVDPAADNSPQTVTVNLEVIGAILDVSANAFSSVAYGAGANPDPNVLTISNPGGNTVNWSIVDVNEVTFAPPAWLTVTPTSGTLNPNESEPVTLSVDITGLPDAQYSYAFQVIDPAAENSPQTVTVDLEVIGPILDVSSNSFSFTGYQDGSNPDDQTLTISNPGGGIVNWLLDLTNKPDWLTIMPTSGDLPHDESESVTLSVDTTGLSIGLHSYSFDVVDPAAENSPQTVTVNLNIGGDRYVPSQYPTIQSAIDAALTGDTIFVEPGMYYENINFNGKDITLTSTDPENPDVVAATIIDGNRNGSVVTFNGQETSDCVLIGFTITNGNSDSGGGIRGVNYSNRTYATISNCMITDNTASSGGGLAYCNGAISNCMITGNTADRYGGGLYYCDSAITNCEITNNWAVDLRGGGLSWCNGTITNCKIAGNTASGDYGSGGGLYDCDGMIINCIIMVNTASGGDGFGGGLNRCDGTITNCTITANTAIGDGGGLSYCDGTIMNCIIWGNTAVHQGDQLYNSLTPTYSCIQDWIGGGIGNVTDNPRFFDTTSPNPPDWDLSLSVDSPCIDAATNTPTGGLPTTDIEGNLRPFDGDQDGDPVADMGAYEFHANFTQPYLFVTPRNHSFSALENGSNPANQSLTVKNYGNHILNWSLDLTDKPAWLTMIPTSGSLGYLESEPITLSVDITGLSGGQYNYSFDIVDPAAVNSPQTVTVDLEVTGPILDVSSNMFVFIADDGGDDPNAQTLTITNSGGGTMNWSVVVPNGSPPAFPDWLTVIPTRGSLSHNGSDDVMLSVDTSGLAEGGYSYSFDIIDQAAQNSPQIVNVYLAIGADIFVPSQQYPTIQSAINAAAEGDTIMVVPGTYYENIYFDVNDVILTSIDPTAPDIVASTIIDGGGNRSVVTFPGGERPATTLQGFTITNGRARDWWVGWFIPGRGGGICGGGNGTTHTNATIADCIITGNVSEWYGGGLYYCDGTIRNCIISENTADRFGGGLYDCDGKIINCIISENTADRFGGGLYDCDGTITNNIIWGNDAGDQGDQLHGSLTPTYSCIQDWTGGGTGNISNDPLFANGAFYLKSEYGRWDPNNSQWVYDDVTSPCIDAGDPNSSQWQNELWPHGGRINMGAYGGTPQASMSPSTIGNVADIDHDDQVSASDLLLLADDWLYNQTLLDTDLNRDGAVDLTDFADLANQWLWIEP